MLFQFVLFRGSKNYEGIKKASLEYAENIKMIDGTAATIFQQTKKFAKDPKEASIDELCKQVKNLHLLLMKQPMHASKQAEPVSYKRDKKGYYASLRKMEEEPMWYRCGKKGHRASECRSKVDMPLHVRIATGLVTLLKACFVKESNEALEKQDVRLAKNSEPTEAKGSGISGQNNMIFVKRMILLKKTIPWRRSRDMQMEKHSLSSRGCRTTSMPTLKRR